MKKLALRSFCMALCLGALASAGPVAPGHADDFPGSSETAIRKAPPGAVKLPSSRIKKVGPILCGRFQSNWFPGRKLKGNYFMRHDRQAALYRKKAKKARTSKARTRYRKLANRYQGLVRSQTPKCRRQSTPLRFRLSDAIGVALTESSASRTVVRTPRTTTGSNLSAILSSGELTDAIVSGSVTISEILVGPDNALYVLFPSPVDLSTSQQSPDGCVLAKVTRDSGVPTCIDSTLRQIWGDPNSQFNPAVQFDAAGGIVYTGSTSNGNSVVRRWLNGVVTDLVNSDNIYVRNFLALEDGSVLIAGYTRATLSAWTRRIEPSGQVSTVAGSESQFMNYFPDGNVYMGFWSLEDFGVKRFLTASGSLEAKYWISSTLNSITPQFYFNAGDYCQDDVRPQREGFCGTFGALTQGRIYETSGDSVYALAGGFGQRATPMKYFPTVEYVSTSLEGAVVGTASGNRLVFSGTDVSDRYKTIVYDTTGETEVEVIGPGSEVEIYHLVTDESSGKVLFDGLRFSDNSYVIGEIDPVTGSFEFLDSTSTRLADLQAFATGG